MESMKRSCIILQESCNEFEEVEPPGGSRHAVIRLTRRTPPGHKHSARDEATEKYEATQVDPQESIIQIESVDDGALTSHEQSPMSNKSLVHQTKGDV